MIKSLPRRQFLASGLAAATAATVSVAQSAADEKPKPGQEFYELRIYRCSSAEKQAAVVEHVQGTLQPALKRMQLDRVGIFLPIDAKVSDVYVVIAYTSLDQLSAKNTLLEKDAEYQKAGADFFALSKDQVPFSRIESRLLKAFAGMHVMNAPSKTSSDRLLELRIYESHNEHMAQLKVEMFNEGEIDIMRDVKLGPVFFGETLISGDTPNLTYMLSADSDADHKEHWVGFRNHPDWNRMKVLPRYKDTVSKIVSVLLKPTGGSQI